MQNPLKKWQIINVIIKNIKKLKYLVININHWDNY